MTATSILESHQCLDTCTGWLHVSCCASPGRRSCVSQDNSLRVLQALGNLAACMHLGASEVRRDAWMRQDIWVGSIETCRCWLWVVVCVGRRWPTTVPALFDMSDDRSDASWVCMCVCVIPTRRILPVRGQVHSVVRLCSVKYNVCNNQSNKNYSNVCSRALASS